MNDTVITAYQKKREAVILLVLFLVACLINLIAIISYHTAWSELITELPRVIILTLILYALTGVIRILFHVVKKWIFRKKYAGESTQ